MKIEILKNKNWKNMYFKIYSIFIYYDGFI